MAWLTPLGIIHELFVMKEELLTCSEHKFSTTVCTFQISVDEWHGTLRSISDRLWLSFDNAPQHEGLSS